MYCGEAVMESDGVDERRIFNCKENRTKKLSKQNGSLRDDER